MRTPTFVTISLRITLLSALYPNLLRPRSTALCPLHLLVPIKAARVCVGDQQWEEAVLRGRVSQLESI
jgi:hypothetical protein